MPIIRRSEEETIERNKRLVAKYPFLFPRDWYGKKVEDYDYSYTELDGWPDGWIEAFGEQFCEDIMQELVKHDFVDQYQVVQVKEKYNTSRWYDNGAPGKVQSIISCYEHVSSHVCHYCGHYPAPEIDKGWIHAICPDCYKEVFGRERPDEVVMAEYQRFITEAEADPIYCYRRWAPGDDGWKAFEVDCSDIINRMLERQKIREAEDSAEESSREGV